jgi:hypothetical protein
MEQHFMVVSCMLSLHRLRSKAVLKAVSRPPEKGAEWEAKSGADLKWVASPHGTLHTLGLMQQWMLFPNVWV